MGKNQIILGKIGQAQKMEHYKAETQWKVQQCKSICAFCVFKSSYNYCFQFQQESITFSTSFSRNFSSDKLHLVFVMPFPKTGSHFRELRESTKKRKCNISLETFICILKHLLKSFWRSVLVSFVFLWGIVGHSFPISQWHLQVVVAFKGLRS